MVIIEIRRVFIVSNASLDLLFDCDLTRDGGHRSSMIVTVHILCTHSGDNSVGLNGLIIGADS